MLSDCPGPRYFFPMDRQKILVPFSRPDIDDADIARVVATLKSGWITTGPAVREFEEGLARWLSVSSVVCLNSATAGMELVLRALGIGPGDEVITTVYTYAATANVIRHVGARPVLVDTALDSFEIDSDAVAAALSPRTKAVIPVDFAGCPCDYARLGAILETARAGFRPENDFQAALGRPALLADAAHSFGSSYAGLRVPEACDFSVYSFHAVKNLTTAEGGAVAFRDSLFGADPQLAGAFLRRLRLLALHGQSKDALAKMAAGSWEYDIELSGYKHNMTDIQAALAIGQLGRYEAQLARREEICAAYRAGLSGAPWLHPPGNDDLRKSSCHIYPLRIAGFSEERRNALIAALAGRGISTNVHFKPLPLFTAFRDEYRMADFPHARAQYVNEVTLPLWPGLSAEQIEWTIESLPAVLSG